MKDTYMRDIYIIVTLMALSGLVAMGGIPIAIICEMIYGYDYDTYTAGILCFPIGMVGMTLTALLQSMVDTRFFKR